MKGIKDDEIFNHRSADDLDDGYVLYSMIYFILYLYRFICVYLYINSNK